MTPLPNAPGVKQCFYPRICTPSRCERNQGTSFCFWDTQASASLLKIAWSSADVRNDSCSLDAFVHSPPLSWHCPAKPPPTHNLDQGGWGRDTYKVFVENTHTHTHYVHLQCNTFIGSATFQVFVMYNTMQVKKISTESYACT